MVICMKGVTGTDACRVMSDAEGCWWWSGAGGAGGLGGSGGVIYRERRVRINFTRRRGTARDRRGFAVFITRT